MPEEICPVCKKFEKDCKCPVIGIDLGTANSAAAILADGEPKVIAKDITHPERKSFPSFVAFDENGDFLCAGEQARAQRYENPKRTVYNIKRLIGRTYDEVKDEIKTLPYEVGKGLNGEVIVKLGIREYSPEEISTFILKEIKQCAEKELDISIKKARITVPDYFEDAQREATKKAGENAGFEVVSLLIEPSASIIAYKYKGGFKGIETDQIIMVFDLGAGTLDVEVMKYKRELTPAGTIKEKIESISVVGDTRLGGTDIDNAIVNWVVEECKKKGVYFKGDKELMEELREKAEEAKIILSKSETNVISIPHDKIEIPLTREKLAELICGIKIRDKTLVDVCKGVIRQALKDAEARLGKEVKIDDVILVGGPTNMPIIQEIVKEEVGEPLRNWVNIKEETGEEWNPMECVAVGAAISEHIGTVTPYAYGYVGEIEVIPEALNRCSEAVKQVLKETQIVREFTPVIEKGVFYPASFEKSIPISPYLSSVDIHVMQLSSEEALKGTDLGVYSFARVPDMRPDLDVKKGFKKMDIVFHISKDGILSVSYGNIKFTLIPKGRGGKLDIAHRDVITAYYSALRDYIRENLPDLSKMFIEQIIAEADGVIRYASKDESIRELIKDRIKDIQTARNSLEDALRTADDRDKLIKALELYIFLRNIREITYIPVAKMNASDLIDVVELDRIPDAAVRQELRSKIETLRSLTEKPDPDIDIQTLMDIKNQTNVLVNSSRNIGLLTDEQAKAFTPPGETLLPDTIINSIYGGI